MVDFSKKYHTDELPTEMSNFDPLPPDEYVAMMTGATEKKTPKGGLMATFEHTIQEGQFAGRIVFQQLNLECPHSQKSEEIATKAVGALCNAIGFKGELKSSDQLLNKRFKMKLKVKPAEEYDHTDPDTGVVSKRMGYAKNEVVNFLPMSAAPSKPVSGKATSAAKEPEKKSTPAWKEKTKAAAK